MSNLSEKLLAGTSKCEYSPAALCLEDGTLVYGRSCGAKGEVFGEICFNTALEGYFEVITDPSYAGQIITMTYPQIGNYGVNLEDAQRREPALRGLVVRDMCETPSNWRSVCKLSDYLKEHGIIAMEGVDTRALVRHIRDNGAMRAVISTSCVDADELLKKVRSSESIVGANLVGSVACEESRVFDELPQSHAFALEDELERTSASESSAPDAASGNRFKVVAYDCGAKDSILQNLLRNGCSVYAVPWDIPAEDVLAMQPDGVFLSNGPGDPEAVEETFNQVGELLGKIPVFGICLGHQMISKAAGAQIEKLKFGHRGANHPVVNLLTGRVEITSQNHGFGLVFSSLGPLVPELCGGIAEHPESLKEWVRCGIAPIVENERYGRVQLTHVNLNDYTPEGIAFLDIPAFSVQYHPEASPGPTDSRYLFEAFRALMGNESSYLNIDIAKNRLNGWKFGGRNA